jgi:hypothetical protein
MPHRVATFFRGHANSFDLTAADKKPKTVRSLSGFGENRPSIGDRTPTSSNSSTHTRGSKDSDERKGSLTMNKTKKSNIFGGSPKNSHKSLVVQPAPAKLDVVVESPPLHFLGQPSNSTGAILTGRLKLKINDEKLRIESFRMRLVIDKKMKKPFHPSCKECTYQESELKVWKFNDSPVTLDKGMSIFPTSPSADA